MKDILSKLVAGQTLDQNQTRAAFEDIMSGQTDPVYVGAFLALLSRRDPTPDELTGAALAMRQYVVPVSAPENVIDTCGAGGTRSRIFNVSTTAAIVAASCGIPVAKHGNRAVTSRSGSADVLQVLGVRVDAEPEIQAQCLREVNICFSFAPRHHPAMQHVAQIRQKLGFATIFNLMGPLTNPAGARKQLAGVPRPELTAPILEVLVRLGAVRAMVVCGTDPDEGFMCELSVGGPTHVSLFDGEEIKSFDLEPRDVGLKKTSSAAMRIQTPEQSAALVRQVLGGSRGSPRDIVLFNSAAALWVGQKSESIREGIKIASTAIDSGRALATLENLIQVSAQTTAQGAK
ncbi:MAG TPA: anthranilate phosphoribosyltransferase [Phycisphaerae bacterium]|nr:anthranilate phosphoribosyltransferase [Phycisphaerae bacterium]